MEAKQILINLAIPSLSDISGGSVESLQMFQEKMLDAAVLSFVCQILASGYSFQDFLYAVAAYPEVQNLPNLQSLIEKSASEIN